MKRTPSELLSLALIIVAVLAVLVMLAGFALEIGRELIGRN